MLGYIKRHHLGILALFIALGGTSYAATQLPRNSVGTGQIRNGAVTPVKLSPGLRAKLGGRTPTGTTPAAPTTWRDPGLLAAIGSAGQHVLSQTVITVDVTAPWVSTGLSISSGQHLWADTRSDGRWTGNPRFFPYSDANGLGPSDYQNCWKIDEDAPVESLIGFIGGTPRNVPEGCRGGTTDPGFITVGNTLTNLSPRTTGQIWLRTNDNTNHISNVGKQIVKVLVTS